MIDLLGSRAEAVTMYKKAVDMNLDFEIYHDQFDLKFQFSTWAAERAKVPFKRIENSQD